MRAFYTVFFCLFAAAASQGRIIYVDGNAPAVNDGTSWQNAYRYVQDALANADYSEKPVEIRVAQGLYRPDESSAEPNGTGNRGATFQLINAVIVKGGYAGLAQPDPNARDVRVYETILSGDLDENDARLANPADIWREPTRADNCQHVVTGSGTDGTAILDGFTLSAGHTSSPGGGMYNQQGSPTIIDCRFTWNCAEWGGGMANQRSSPTVIGCSFEKNAGGGGAVNNGGDSAPKFLNCRFIDNVALWAGGGAMLNGYAGFGSTGNPTVVNCIFSGNWTDRYGGAMYNERSTPTITNCTFSSNAAERGGAIYNYRDSSSILTDCILWGDTAKLGGEIYLAAYDERYPSTISVSYSNVQGGYEKVGVETGCTVQWGHGNIETDPRFVDLNSRDYHLKSEGWRWDRNWSTWVWDDVTSLCIDAGNPGSPLGGEPLTVPADPSNKWGQNLRINMGAYGGSAEASIGPHNWALLADLSNNGTVDLIDFAIFSQDWQDEGPEEPSDLNRNMRVDCADFILAAYDWLATATWVVSPPLPARASDPFPPDGAVNVDTYARLRWTPGHNGLSHDVYFGTDGSSVANAKKPSPVHVSSTSYSVYDPFLLENTTYYWRIDEVSLDGTTKGVVWHFTTARGIGGGTR